MSNEAEAGLTAFLAVGWQLLELAEPAGTTSLTYAWQTRFGEAPDFSEDGDATIGYHAPGHNPRERHLLVARTANAEAIRLTIRLLILRYDLVRLYMVGRALAAPQVDDWTPDLASQPRSVMVWPSDQREIKDSIVIAHPERPVFVHRASVNRASSDIRLTGHLPDALTLPSKEQATVWLESRQGLKSFILLYKSVALSQQDQAAAESDR